MIVHLHRRFEKQFQKLPKNAKQKAKERLQLFSVDSSDPVLNDHRLNGSYVGCRSINVSGDMRMVYKLIDEDTALFVKIGSHSELYG